MVRYDAYIQMDWLRNKYKFNKIKQINKLSWNTNNE